MAWPAPSSGVPSSLVQLSFLASGLRNRDVMGTRDPMVVAYHIAPGGQEEELGRSETIRNTLNPKWVYRLTTAYRFEEIQPLRFVVYDVDTNYKEKASDKFNFEEQDFLGEVRTTFAEILASPLNVLTRPLQGVLKNIDLISSSGTLTICAEEEVDKFGRPEEVVDEFGMPEEVELVLRCTNLGNLETFCKSDPFVRISKLAADGAWTPVNQTEQIQNNRNPTWKPIRMTLQQLCNGNTDRALLVECLDYNSNGKHKVIGGVKTTLNQLQGLCVAGTSLTLTGQPKPSEIVNKSQGNLFVYDCKISPVVTFLDYVLDGCKIDFFVAVDFTASNGDPRSPGSLHYIDPTSGLPSAYQTVIQAVGGVLQHYNTDKRFHCWGFGASINGCVSHCFPLNNNVSNPLVEGIEGIQAAYDQAVYSVEQFGPTFFAPVIRQAASIAAQYQRQHKYCVLLIITNGAILDVQDTITAIVEASYLPLSLLIVGVGNADFSAMDFLDSDKQKLTTQAGLVALRDILQFVPIKGGNLESGVKKLLKELPDQLMSYMKTYGVWPSADRLMAGSDQCVSLIRSPPFGATLDIPTGSTQTQHTEDAVIQGKTEAPSDGNSEQMKEGRAPKVRGPKWTEPEDRCLLEERNHLLMWARTTGGGVIDWEGVSTRLLANHNVDRCSSSCQGRWDTLFKLYRAIWEYDSRIGKDGIRYWARYWGMNADQRSQLPQTLSWKLYMLMESIILVEGDKDLGQKNLLMTRRTKKTRRTGIAQVDPIASTSTLDNASAATGPSPSQDQVSMIPPVARLGDVPGSQGSLRQPESEVLKGVPDARVMVEADKDSSQNNLERTSGTKRTRTRSAQVDPIASTSTQNALAATGPSSSQDQVLMIPHVARLGDLPGSQGSLQPESEVLRSVPDVKVLEDRICAKVTAHIDGQMARIWANVRHMVSANSMGNTNTYEAQGGVANLNVGSSLAHGFEHANYSLTNIEDETVLDEDVMKFLNEDATDFQW